jgi:hypothetical protein
MNHYKDLSNDESEALIDRLGTGLSDMLNKEMIEHNMCPVCLHKTILAMCGAYLTKMEDEIEPHDTVN